MKDFFLYAGLAFAFVSAVVIGRRWRCAARQLLAQLEAELSSVGYTFPSETARFLLSRMLWQPRLLLSDANTPQACAIVEQYIRLRKEKLKLFKWAFAASTLIAVGLLFTQAFVDVYFKKA